MVKTIRIVLEDSEHEEFSNIKGEGTTWYSVLIRGISSLENFPSETSWSIAILDKIDDEND